ncbi:MAG: hypothetical protein AAF493_25015 [Pseudomonadota bacterium]
MSTRLRLRLTMPMLTAAVAVSPVSHGGEHAVAVELNKLEAAGENCRAYLVATNKSNAAFRSMKLDLVMFDVDDLIAKRLAVDIAPLPANKTRVKVFDMTKLACDRVKKILLNGVMQCDDGTGANCDAAVDISSRTVPLIE